MSGIFPEGRNEAWRIPRLLNEVFAEIPVDSFGAKGDGTPSGDGSNDPGTDDSRAFQAAFDYGVSLNRPFVINMGARIYKLGSRIDCSAATHSYAFAGAGRGQTILCPTPFGADKALFDGGITPPSRTSFYGFTVERGSRSKNHPIVFFYPDANRLSLRRINARRIGNSVVFASRVFNLDWTDLNFAACGYQPLRRSISARATTQEGQATVTVDDSEFTVADEGEVIYIQQFSSGSSSDPNNSAIVAKIASVDAPDQITLDRPCFASASNRRICFDSITGSISSGAAALTLNADVLDEDDEGRFIYIDGAGSSSGQPMIAKIQSVTSASTCTLDRNASATVSDRYVWFTPTIYLGDEGEGIVNDIVIGQLLIENYRGPAVYLEGGLNVHLQNFKAHGRAFGNSNSFAVSRNALVIDRTSKVNAAQVQLEFGCHGPESGYVIVSGDNASVSLDQVVVNAACHGGYIVDFRSNHQRASLQYGMVFGTRDLSKDAGIVKTADETSASRVYGGYVGSVSNQAEREALQAPVLGGGFRSAQPDTIEDDDFAKYAPYRDIGHAFVSTADASERAYFFYQATGTPTCTSISDGGGVTFTTGALDGTTGSDGDLTISAASDGYIYIENRTGGSVRPVITFLC